MYQYANGYSCAMSKERDHIVLQFRQNSPAFKTDGTVSGTEVNVIASIIMDTDMALALGHALCDIVEDDDEEDTPEA